MAWDLGKRTSGCGWATAFAATRGSGGALGRTELVAGRRHGAIIPGGVSREMLRSAAQIADRAIDRTVASGSTCAAAKQSGAISGARPAGGLGAIVVGRFVPRFGV